jgi:hypothetical protein
MLDSVMATVENMKKEMITKTDLAQTTQLLDDVTTTVENLKKDANSKFNLPAFYFSLSLWREKNCILICFPSSSTASSIG